MTRDVGMRATLDHCLNSSHSSGGFARLL